MFESSEKLSEHFKFSINNLKNFTSDPRCSSIQVGFVWFISRIPKKKNLT